MVDRVQSGDVIVSNQVSGVLEWVFMEMVYGPVFTGVATRSGRYGVRKLGLVDIVGHAMGIRFPQEVKENDPNFYTDLTTLRDSLYVKNRPIVVFPEATKTNGRGILQIEDDIV